jgi:hypothetical protein
MVHYKVNPVLCEGLADGHRAFCGIEVGTPGEQFHLLGPVAEAGPAHLRPWVDCPKCIRMYDAVINDYLAEKNP